EQNYKKEIVVESNSTPSVGESYEEGSEGARIAFNSSSRSVFFSFSRIILVAWSQLDPRLPKKTCLESRMRRS
ncbi:hypothetical protein LINGRAHAP2_LOCUS20083, partial [Linum grandiflorum]